MKWITFCLIVFYSCALFPQDTGATEFFELYTGVNVWARSSFRIRRKTSIEECARTCVVNAACSSFVYSRVTNFCYGRRNVNFRTRRHWHLSRRYDFYRKLTGRDRAFLDRGRGRGNDIVFVTRASGSAGYNVIIPGRFASTTSTTTKPSSTGIPVARQRTIVSKARLRDQTRQVATVWRRPTTRSTARPGTIASRRRLRPSATRSTTTSSTKTVTTTTSTTRGAVMTAMNAKRTRPTTTSAKTTRPTTTSTTRAVTTTTSAKTTRPTTTSTTRAVTTTTRAKTTRPTTTTTSTTRAVTTTTRAKTSRPTTTSTTITRRQVITKPTKTTRTTTKQAITRPTIPRRKTTVTTTTTTRTTESTSLDRAIEEQCDRPIGIEDESFDLSQITASSYYWRFSPSNVGINTGSGWMASTTDVGEYIEIDFGEPKSIVAVATQGSSYLFGTEFVSEYKLRFLFHPDGIFETYKENGQEKIFIGNMDSTTIQKNRLSTPVSAYKIQFHPLKFNTNIMMRAEVFEAC